MDIFPLDEIKPTAGTPLKITNNFPLYEDAKVNTIYIQVLPGNLGDVYFGRENLNVATKVGIIARLRPPTLNHLPDLAFNMPINIHNPLKASAYRIDVATTGDGAILSIGQA